VCPSPRGASSSETSTSPFCTRPAPAPVAARRGRPLRLTAWAGQTARHPQSPSAKRQLSRSRRCVARERGKEEGLLTAGASGSITNDQRSSLLCRLALRLMARLALVAAYSRRKWSCSNRERANAVGLAASLISWMRSSLSMRGTIRLGGGWRGPKPRPTRRPPRPFDAFRSDSSRSWREEGDTPWCQESAFSFSTLPV
jgi:hypothetical protein